VGTLAYAGDLAVGELRPVKPLPCSLPLTSGIAVAACASAAAARRTALVVGRARRWAARLGRAVAGPHAQLPRLGRALACTARVCVAPSWAEPGEAGPNLFSFLIFGYFNLCANFENI
jgi:hypothetical protein